MRNIFVRLASFIWVVAVPQTFAQLGPELPLRRALFNLILFSHSPQSFNLHSHVSISKLSVRSCVSECACVHVRVCLCVCGQTVCGTWLWSFASRRLWLRLSLGLAKRRGYTPLPRPQVTHSRPSLFPFPARSSPLALSHLAVN